MMIKLPERFLDRQNAIIKAQGAVGVYKNYLHDVLKPALERGDWDELESLDIGFTTTGESLGKIGDNDAWTALQSFFEPNASQSRTLDFTQNSEVIERNLRNQLKTLALKMMWLSPRSHSFNSIYASINGLKKCILPLLHEGTNSFEHLDFKRLETWVLTGCTEIDFERREIYVSLNKLTNEQTGLSFKVSLPRKLSETNFGLTLKEAEQYTVIPQRLYYLGLKKTESLVNELYPIRNELGNLSNYITTYFEKLYHGYATYLTSDESTTKAGKIKWHLDKSNKGCKEKALAFQEAFLALKFPTKIEVIETLMTHQPEIRTEYKENFHPNHDLCIGTKKITGIGEARILFKDLTGGCLWALQARTGMRSDEMFHLNTTNGCIKDIIDGQVIYVIHANLSKTVKGLQAKQDEFITTELGKKAYEVLQALHAPIRKLHPNSYAFFHKVKEDYTDISKSGLSEYVQDWFNAAIGHELNLTNDDVMDLKISDPNLLFNVGDKYSFTAHQLRRSYAYYLIGYELCSFQQLKQQFSHVSLAMTRHYAKNATKFQKLRKKKQNLAYAIDEERIDQQAQVYLNIFKKLANKERVAGGKGKEFASNMMKTERNLFKDKVDNDMLSINYWKKQIREQKRHIHAVAPGVYCTSTGCSLRTQVNLLECVDCKNDYIVDAVFAEAKRKEAEINMLWDIEHDELTPQTASESYIKITAAERIMNDLGIDYEPVVLPKEVQDLLIPHIGVPA